MGEQVPHVFDGRQPTEKPDPLPEPEGEPEDEDVREPDPERAPEPDRLPLRVRALLAFILVICTCYLWVDGQSVPGEMLTLTGAATAYRRRASMPLSTHLWSSF
jgi:hypothetical protein